jgi:hypothetical protein
MILSCLWLLLPDNTKVNTSNDGDDEKNDHANPEADPLLFPRRSRTILLPLASSPKFPRNFTRGGGGGVARKGKKEGIKELTWQPPYQAP